uniref:Evasin n=1 Tax=Amblyomma triste TaxID=251400 RepID=A0A023G9M8_AMBTT
MWFAWIFALIVGFASLVTSKESVPPAQGCGEDPPTTSPSPPPNKEHGFYKDGKGCLHYFLESYSGHYTTTCTKTCGRTKYTYRGIQPCMRLLENTLSERADTRPAQPTYCRLGRCFFSRCILGPKIQKCSVPNNITETPNNSKAE